MNTFEIPEADWRQFKLIHSQLVDRFSRRVLEELGVILQESFGTAHDRYSRIYHLIQTRNKEMAHAFNDFRRSTAVRQLIIMRGMGLLTDDDLQVFSEQTQKRIHGSESAYRSGDDG